MAEESPLFTPEDGQRVQEKPSSKRHRSETVSIRTQYLEPPSAEKYRKIKKVGVGAYGSVFMAERTADKEVVAIKVTARKEDPILGGFPLSLLREISILRRCRHDSIVQIHEVSQTPQGDPLIVMEFCQASLLELLHSRTHDLSFSEVKYVIRQILDATSHLHELGIMHRDLATKNVLFNLSGDIKVCDFGISRRAFGWDTEFGCVRAANMENPNMIVSLPYRAIELLLGEPDYGPAIDVWSVGCILAEILLCQAGKRQTIFGGDPSSPNKTPQLVVEEIFRTLGRPTQESWPGLAQLPLLKSLSGAKTGLSPPHQRRGEERAFIKRYFVSGEGSCANSKFVLTESCFDLLGGLFSLCPEYRPRASEQLKHTWFTEKPMPEWHKDHWAKVTSEIPRGDDMRRHTEETHAILRKLSQEEVRVQKEDASKVTSLKENVKEALERRAEERQLAEKAATRARNTEEVPRGWTKQWSASKQRFYYHHSATGKSQWVDPLQ